MDMCGVLTLDVWTGEVRAPAGAAVIRAVPYRGRREGLLTTELLLSGELTIFEATALWPDALRVAKKLADVADWFSQLRWRINKNLNPFGVQVCDDEEDFVWRPKPFTGQSVTPCTLSTANAVTDLRMAAQAILEARYDDAATKAIEVLAVCPASLAANRVVGIAHFQHQVEIQHSVLCAVARRLSERRIDVECATTNLRALWRLQRHPQRWHLLPRSVGELESELVEMDPIFRAADRFLGGDVF